ncbi:MAG: metallophosphoesterase family protein [bacterium]|nr:metallophosphoesterase family protein [bacterium]
MKVAVFSDVHDNLLRWREAAEIIRAEKIKVGFCCGDIGDLQTVEEVAKSFETLYLALGNLDFKIKNMTGLFPENVIFARDYGEIELKKVKIAYVHSKHIAKQLAESGKYDIVFYGHTHTPWEEKVGSTVLLNPGEVAGHFGKASFAIYDLRKMKAELKLLT